VKICIILILSKHCYYILMWCETDRIVHVFSQQLYCNKLFISTCESLCGDCQSSEQLLKWSTVTVGWTLYIELPIIWVVWGIGCSVTWIWWLHGGDSCRTEFPCNSCPFMIFNISTFCLKVKDFSFYTEVFLGDIMDLWVKDLRYTETWSQVELTCSVMVPVWGKTKGSAASDNWENMCITALFLK
jgi:hypothetical protein